MPPGYEWFAQLCEYFTTKIQKNIAEQCACACATWVWGHNVPQAERSESPLSEDEEFRANGTQVRKSWVGGVGKIGGEGGVGCWWRYPDMTLSWHSSSPGSIWQPGGAHWEKEQLLNTVFLCDKLQAMIRLLEAAGDICNKIQRRLTWTFGSLSQAVSPTKFPGLWRKQNAS